MKFIRYCLLIIASSTFLFSCKKDDSAAAANTKYKIKTYTEDITSEFYGHTAITYNLTYDNSNRITGVVSAADPQTKFAYTYPDQSRFTMDIYQSGNLNIHEDAFLNNAGLLDSTLQYNDTEDTTAEKYIYNAGKQLIKKYEYFNPPSAHPDNIVTYTYDSNGNLVSESDNSSTTTYHYDSVIPATVYISPVYIFQPQQLPTSTVLSMGGSEYTAVHTYTFDGSNRIITDKAVASNGDIVIKSYTYF